MRNRLPLIAILLAQVVLGVLYAFATPIFEASDEYLHYPVVREIVTNHRLPVQTPGVRTSWEQEGSQPPLYYLIGAAVTGWIDISDYPANAVANPFVKAGRPGTPDNINLMAHPPGQSPAQGGTALAVMVIRWLSVLMGTVTAGFAYRISREMAPRRDALALLAAALVAFNPMVLFINASVNNDNLLMLLSSAVVWLLLRDLRDDRRGPRWGVTLLTGLLAGAAALTKLSGLVLLPTAALAYTLTAYRLKDWRAWIVRGLTLAIIVAAVAGWWYLRNLRLYGEVTGMETMVAVAGARPAGFGLRQLLPEWRGFWQSYWGVFGAFNVLTGPWFYWLAGGLTLAALAGLGVRLVRLARGRALPRNWQGHLVLLVFLGLTALGLLRWTLQTLASQGRLLFGAAAVISFYLALGLLAWVPRRWQMRLALATAALLAAVAAVVAGSIAPAYRPPAPVAALPADATPLDITCGDILLSGYRLDAPETESGTPLRVTLYWSAAAPILRDLQLSINGYGYREENVAKLDTWPGGGLRPTSHWRPGEVYPDYYELATEAVELPSLVRLGLAWNTNLMSAAANEPVRCLVGGQPVDSVFLDGGALVGPLPDAAAAAPLATFDQGIELTGATTRIEDGRLRVDLIWRAAGPVAADYTVFVHLFDSNGDKVSQGDGPPRDGYWPTSRWRPGEPVESSHVLDLPPGADPAGLSLGLGLYDPASGERLPAFAPGGAELRDRMMVLQVEE